MFNASVQECDAPRDASNATVIAVELLRRSLHHLSNNREVARQLISNACSMLETTSELESSDSLIRGGLVFWQVRKVKEYIDANLGGPISIAKLSALVRLGPGYFQRVFKKSFGICPHAFVMARRVQRAQTLMLTTEEPLSVIALAAGFSDQAHFTTRFRRATGMPPSLWRRERICRRDPT